MMIGILSDTHNNIKRTLEAINIFKERSIDMILHIGDIGSADILSLFAGFNVKFVFGNEDKNREELNNESLRLGFGLIGCRLVFDAEGKKFIMFHGSDVPFFRECVASGQYDYIIKGHTHFFENYIVNNSRVINPGALYKAYEFTVAILDTETDHVEAIYVE